MNTQPIPFRKYHGLGNDFILLDNRVQSEPILSPAVATQWCDRHFGIGADGVIFLLPSTDTQSADYHMRLYNSDGSEPEMCGNGIRCLGQFLSDLALPSPTGDGRYRIATKAGVIIPQVHGDGTVTVDMGTPILSAAEIPTTLATAGDRVLDQPMSIDHQSWLVTTVSMGNPHCVTFVPDVATIPLGTIGPLFEHHPAFPRRTNTEFVEVVRPDYLKMRVWERGAGATLACGTGACAVVVAAVLTGRGDRTCTVELPGGPLHIQWQAETNHVLMTGAAVAVFAGETCLS
ncbi:MAG: diaminopimelate epimerase [Oscillatoriales cyanobacterium SM2_2_1]|nr:diaminopimelate epimerase [Oscillatoriales cyanobacterium SM2_2_1]